MSTKPTLEPIDITVERIVAHEADYRRATEIAIIGRDLTGRRHIARIIWENVGDSIILNPTLTLPYQGQEAVRALQGLANDLWVLGHRPEAARGSVGQLQAVSAHLEDMRTLVFDTLAQKVGGTD